MAGGVAQCVGPEFKPQYHNKEYTADVFFFSVQLAVLGSGWGGQCFVLPGWLFISLYNLFCGIARSNMLSTRCKWSSA
jgi:hypothetical protein